MPGDELVDPMVFAWPWALVGVAFLLAAVAVVVAVVRLTRPAPDPAPEPAAEAAATRSAPSDRFAPARAATLHALDDLERRWRSQELDDRRFHLELRRELRVFAAARTGRDASTLTVADLRREHGTKTFGLEMQRLLEPTFAPAQGRRLPRPERALKRARTLVGRW
ncbi:hypothetical protein [Isoptericola croceus]|uniref:hypothetical protein n=1 Tax=Isoptericola croceus TaxID=3031406 RepID=UPI0023F74BD3|nr:hypothetical protein [Isoptericola croceus]